jgi:hypothetical protein
MEAQLQATHSYKRMIGLELAGPHSNRTSLVVLDYYPSMSRLIVSHVVDHLGTIDDQSSDTILLEQLHKFAQEVTAESFLGICTQAPLSLPPFFKKDSERIQEERWLLDLWHKAKPKPNLFMPYLNRPVDAWLRYFTPERFHISEAMGSNMAPLAARALYLKEKLSLPIFENTPRATMSRIVQSLEFSRFWPKLYSDVDKGLSVRQDFFERLLQKLPQLFVYEGDLETLIIEINSFQAFLSGLALFLHSQQQCDSVPDSFPQSASWILLPRQRIRWTEIFRKPNAPSR